MGLMRRLAAAALAAVLVLSTALGERVTFRLSADIDPVQYPAQERKLAQGLKSLFRLLTVEGATWWRRMAALMRALTLA